MAEDFDSDVDPMLDPDIEAGEAEGVAEEPSIETGRRRAGTPT